MQYEDAKPDTFLTMLRKSGLIESALIDSLLTDFEQRAAPASPFGSTITALESFLIGGGHLTAWHCQKLRDKKYKGFFFHEFKLLDHLGNTDRESFYLAKEGPTERIAIVAIEPPPSGRVLDARFHVERYLE